MSFPSLHDALSSLLPGARGAPDWLLRPGMLAFGDGLDVDPDGDRARPPGPDGVPDGDVDALPRLPGTGDGGNGPVRHGHADAGLPAHVRNALGEALRGPAQAPLAPAMPQGSPDASLQALARELQQLPPSVLRQLSDVLQRNPDALRAMPAQPEALATVLSRAAAEPGPTPPAMAAEARRLAQGPEATLPAARSQEGEAARDARQPGGGGIADLRTAGDARTLEARPGALPQGEIRDPRAGPAAEARPAWAGAEAGPPGPRASAAGAELPATANAFSRTDGAATTAQAAVPTSQPVAPPPGTPQAQGAPLAQEGATTLVARADAAGSTVERGGQPAGFSALGGVAAGVTLAAVANPAGTTHAHAPEAAVRARGRAERAHDRDRRGQGEASGDKPNGRQVDGRKPDSRHPHQQARQDASTADPAGTAPRPSPASPSASAAAAGSTAANRTAESRADNAADAGDAEPGAPVVAALREQQAAAGHAAPVTSADRSTRDPGQAAPDRAAQDPEAAHSRRQQWLYWSLIAVTYACLGLALATVAPDLTGLPIPAESLGTWRNALTGVGLLTGLWAWLLARRLR